MCSRRCGITFNTSGLTRSDWRVQKLYHISEYNRVFRQLLTKYAGKQKKYFRVFRKKGRKVYPSRTNYPCRMYLISLTVPMEGIWVHFQYPFSFLLYFLQYVVTFYFISLSSVMCVKQHPITEISEFNPSSSECLHDMAQEMKKIIQN